MASAEVLLKAEPAPNTVPVNTLGKKEHELPINTGAYTSQGQPTAGFRTAKYTPEEWFQNNYSKYYQSFTDRDNAERVQHESKKLANETLALTNRFAVLYNVYYLHLHFSKIKYYLFACSDQLHVFFINKVYFWHELCLKHMSSFYYD